MTGAWLAAFLVQWLLLVVVAVAVIGLYRQVVPTLMRAELMGAGASAVADTGLPVGSLVPPVTFTTGPAEVSLADLTRGRAAVLVFLDEECAPCQRLLEELRALRAAGGSLGDAELFLVVNRVLDDAVPEGVTVLLQEDGTASRALAQVAFPQAFVIERSTAVHRAFPNTVADLRRLLERAGNQSVDSSGLRGEEVGASALGEHRT